MPSLRKQRNLCFIGDSQLGSLQTALRDGLTSAPKGLDVEFWGVPGPQFRQIHWHNNAIVASEEALEMVQKVNTAGRGQITATDFDTVVFYGARLRVAEFFGPYFDWAHRHGDLPSSDVMKTTAQEFVWETRAYRMAHSLADAGCRVIYVPGPFYTADILDLTEKNRFLHHYPDAVHGTPEMRDRLWRVLEDVSATLGITLVRQPDETVTQGVLTKPAFACEDALAEGDIGHKSPAFAARWMQDVWPLLRQKSKAA